MNINSKITLAIRNFFKKYGRIIAIVFFVWLAIFIVNKYLENRPKEVNLSKSYTPDSPIMDDTKDVSTKNATKIHELVDQYFNYCMNKDYQSAFDILTDDCKEYVFESDLNNFKDYVDDIFTEGKTYNIQNYSNVDNVYVYILTILDDVEKTGTTGGYDTYQERIALIKNDNEFKIANYNYIMNQKIEKVEEDNYLKVTVNSKDVGYAKESYTVTVTNKSNAFVIISDTTLSNEVELNIGNELRKAINLVNGIYSLEPGETKIMYFVFDKYFDDENKSKEIRFNSIRVIDDYEKYISDDNSADITVDIGEDILDTSSLAQKVYSMNISLEN